MRSVRRHIITAVGCLIAGVAVNVVVAWTFAAVTEFRYPRSDLGPRHQWSNGRVWVTHTLSDPGALRFRVWPTQESAPRDAPELPSWCRVSGSGGICSAYGWPMLSLSTTWSNAGARGDPGWRIPGVDKVLPFSPIPRGFIVNSFVYGLTLWCVLIICRALHRSIRVRRSLCPGCGYPLGSSTQCPECGSGVPTRPVT